MPYSNTNKAAIIIGIPDSLIAKKLSNNPNIDYLWVSSLIMSSMFGLKDNGIIDLEVYVPFIAGITNKSKKPVILDFDIGGRNKNELKKILIFLKN